MIQPCSVAGEITKRIKRDQKITRDAKNNLTPTSLKIAHYSILTHRERGDVPCAAGGKYVFSCILCMVFSSRALPTTVATINRKYLTVINRYQILDLVSQVNYPTHVS